MSTTSVSPSRLPGWVKVVLVLAVVVGAAAGWVLIEQAGDERDPLSRSELVGLAEQMRIRDATVHETPGWGLVTGDYIRDDGSVAPYKAPLYGPGDVYGALAEHYVPIEAAVPAAQRRFAWFSAIGVAVGLTWLGLAWRQRAGPFTVTPEAAGEQLDAFAVRRALGMLLVGGAFVVVNVEINQFDLVNDTIGWVLVCLAVWSLREAPGGWRHRQVMWVELTGSVVCLGWSVLVQLDPGLREGVGQQAVTLVGLGLLVALCVGMANLAAVHRLPSRRSWTISLWLVAALWGGVYVAGSAASAVTEAAQSSFTEVTADGSGLVGMLFVVLLVPLLSLTWAVLRTRSELQPSAPRSPTGAAQ